MGDDLSGFGLDPAGYALCRCVICTGRISCLVALRVENIFCERQI